MKRFFSFLLIFLITATFSFADSIINDIEDFSKLFPRPEGSAAEQAALQLIISRLDDLDVKYNEMDFSGTKGYHSFSSCVDAEIKGLLNDSLITLIPVDSAYGVSAALSIIKYYSSLEPQLTMRFIFLGAERTPDGNLGTKNFLEHYFQEDPAAFIYMNFPVIPESFRIVPGADGSGSPFFLFDSVKKALDSAGIPHSYSNTEALLFRLSATGTESMIADYLAEGYPAIELTGEESVELSQNSIPGSPELKAFYDELLNTFTGGLPSDWDRNWIFGLSEQQYLMIYIAALAMIMVFPIFRRRHFGWYMHTLIKNFWILPLLFGFIFIFLSISSILITFLMNRMGFNELWQYNPLFIFLFKLSISLLFYSLAFKLIKKLPFSKRGSFYSISAIFFLVIELFVLTWINLSLSFFALWPLVSIFLFTILRKPVIKLILLILSIIPITIVLIETINLPALPALRIIITSPLYGDLIAALVLLPFILAAIRLDMLSPPSRKLTRFLPLIFSIISTGLLFAVLLYSPFDESNPQPVEITEKINDNSGERLISVDSPMRIKTESENILIDAVSTLTEYSENIQIELKTRSFLNRKIVNIKLKFIEEPEKVSVVLNSEAPLTLYESNFPAEWLPSSNKLEVFIGRNPALPIEFSLTLNRNAEINLDIKAQYPAEAGMHKINGRDYNIRYIKIISRKYTDADR